MTNYYIKVNGFRFVIQYCSILNYYAVYTIGSVDYDGIRETGWRTVKGHTDTLTEAVSLVSSYAGRRISNNKGIFKKYLEKVEKAY